MNDDLTYQNQLESLYDWPNENTNNSNTFLVKYTQICFILIISYNARGVIAVYHIALGLFQPKNGLFSSFSRSNENSDGGFGISVQNEMNHSRGFFDLVVF